MQTKCISVQVAQFHLLKESCSSIGLPYNTQCDHFSYFPFLFRGQDLDSDCDSSFHCLYVTFHVKPTCYNVKIIWV